MSQTAGYSGTPLARKLGIGRGSRVALVAPPAGLGDLLEPLPPGVELRSRVQRSCDVIVIFARDRARLERRLYRLAEAIFPDGGLWVCWPKRASGVATDLTEDVVRALCLPVGLVDNKVAAVDETWSGLRFVWRRERRG